MIDEIAPESTEYPKFLFLDAQEQSILVTDEAEEKQARASGFRDTWGKQEEKKDEKPKGGKAT